MLTTVLLASAALLAPQRPTPAYSSAVLPGHLSTQPSVAARLNDRAEVVGYGIEEFWFEGAFWPDPQTVVGFVAAFGFESSFGYGINDAGAYVGSASFDATRIKETVFVVEPGRQPRFLPELVEHRLITSAGFAITDSGLIAGMSDTVPTVGLFGNPQTRAVLWENDVPRNLGTLGGDLSIANGLNESKLVVGISNLKEGGLIRAFAWTEKTGMVQLPGTHPDARTLAADVNAAGLIVGDADGVTRLAATWPDLHTLVTLPLREGDDFSEAFAVNDLGQVVGRAGNGPGFGARLWQGGAALDLAALAVAPGLTINEAIDINDRGQVLVRAWDFESEPARMFNVILTPDLQFADLGFGLAGTRGTPVLRGYSNLIGGGPLVLEVEGARAGALAWVVIGGAQLGVPFLGGTLVPDPSPPGGAVLLATDAQGRLRVNFRWPGGVPPGTSIWYQVWILDPVGPQGFAATNALRSTSP